MSDNDSDFGTFLIGFVVGALTGAAVALLFAPQSGEETRLLIKDKSIELKDRAVESAEEMRTKGTQLYEEQRQRVETAIDAGMKAAQQKKEELLKKAPPAKPEESAEV